MPQLPRRFPQVPRPPPESQPLQPAYLFRARPGSVPLFTPVAVRQSYNRNAVRQSFETEILDRGGVPEHQVARAYRDLVCIHRFLGDTRAVISAARRNPVPVRCIMDIGCAAGGVLRHIQARLGVEAVGVDLNPPAKVDAPFPILRADAIRDPLPSADLAFSMYMVHHL